MAAQKDLPRWDSKRVTQFTGAAIRTGKLIIDTLLPEYCPLCETALDSSFEEQVICRYCVAIHDSSRIIPELSCLRCSLPLVKAPTAERDEPSSSHAPHHEDARVVNIFCPDCLLRPPCFQRSIICTQYGSVPAIMINALKVNKQFYAARFIALEMIKAINKKHASSQNTIDSIAQDVDALLPVPLHTSHQRARGFNQALEIAILLGKHFNLPVLGKAATRLTETTAQKTLNRTERQKALRGAFKVTSEGVAGKRIAIVDDVVTTTSTVRELARTLSQAGCLDSEVWAYARTPSGKLR